MFSLGGCPEIEAEVGFDMIEAYVFAFARHHCSAIQAKKPWTFWMGP